MKRNWLILGFVVLVSVLAAAAYNVTAAGKDPQRTFKAKSFEYVTNEGVVEGSDCPFFEVNIMGNGTGNHLGKFSVVRRHCFTPPDHPAFDPQKGVIHDGTYVITTAKGDTLWGTYYGELTPTEFGNEGPIRGIISSPSTIDGGTGRFANASGLYMAKGDYDLIADEGTFEFLGWISY
jgi:hypothetical protein